MTIHTSFARDFIFFYYHSRFLCEILVISMSYILFLLAFFSMEGTQLGVAKAAWSPPYLPFPGRRSCVLILGEICFLTIVFCYGFYFSSKLLLRENLLAYFLLAMEFSRGSCVRFLSLRTCFLKFIISK